MSLQVLLADDDIATSDFVHESVSVTCKKGKITSYLSKEGLFCVLSNNFSFDQISLSTFIWA